jgi:peptide/nickel transport system substrate-binding protein
MLLLSFLLLLATALIACGGPSSSTPKSTKQVPLTIVPNTAGDLTRNFNPYSPNVTYGSLGVIYETLLFFNRLDGSVKPWLADSYQYSSDGTVITFHLHKGVQWSDGKDFSSADVVFTLNLLKKYSALDVNSMWPFIKEVSAPDSSTVVVKLKALFEPILWYLGGQTWILPQHLWSSVKGDPSQYADPDPVGTGPYVLKSFSPQILSEVKNPHYWQAGKPVVNEIRFPAYNSNTSAELALHKGDIQWTGLYLPDIQKTYIARDPAHNHYWFPPSDVVMLYVNLAKFPFNLLPVRQAISAAIDRQKVSQQGESGYEPPAHPTGLILPSFKDFLSPDYSNTSFSLNTAKAEQLLQGAGFSKGSDGIYAKDGKKLVFSLSVVSGWTDWISSCQIIAKNLADAGMKVNINVISYDAYYNSLQMGSFDTALSWTNAGPSPYYAYAALLRSANTAPVGQSANSNFERWNDPATDKALDQFAGSLDKTTRMQAVAALQKIMVEQLPSIPLMNEPYWYEYSTAHFTGWVDEQHPYALPSPFVYPDNEVVLLNLRPV